eukprot:TRINITY_DN4151_c0_g1_i1.p3 TRINITY_DN4151_c0_g1~~TRINITY_DN4151_c0_g1_i1.p3  ORF type:complete len:167 (-),score=45.81 TRINITY_DN4151_c0_g1_i1:65-565(-)
MACQRPSAAMVSLLLAHGADANRGNKLGDTPLHVAARSGLAEHVRALVARGGADVHARNAQGRTPLEQARHAGSEGGCENEDALRLVVALLEGEEAFLALAGCVHPRLGANSGANVAPIQLLAQVRRLLWDCPDADGKWSKRLQRFRVGFANVVHAASCNLGLANV